MENLKLLVLTKDQYSLLNKADPASFFVDNERQRLERLINKLVQFKKDCSRHEIILLKKFRDAPLNLLIPAGTVCQDPVHIKGNLLVEGQVEAEIKLDGGLVVGDKGVVQGPVTGKSLVCRGTIRGDVLIQGTVHLSAQGNIEGSVEAASLHIEDGGRFSGQCRLDPELKPQPRTGWGGFLKRLGIGG